MFYIVALVLVVSLGVVFVTLFSSQGMPKRNNTGLGTFINNKDCFVRINDKTNYDLLQKNYDPANVDFEEYVRSSLDIRIYDIRSALYNFPKGIQESYSDILAYPNDIYDLFCKMEAQTLSSEEGVHIYKYINGKPADASSGFSTEESFGYSAQSIALFMKHGILAPDQNQSKLKHLTDEVTIHELLDTAKECGVVLLGSTKEQLFKDAYRKGVLANMQASGAKPPTAFRVTESYFPMETAFFEIYCNDIAKNLKGAGSLYINAVIERACKVNVFSKDRPRNRLTVMLEQLKEKLISETR